VVEVPRIREATCEVEVCRSEKRVGSKCRLASNDNIERRCRSLLFPRTSFLGLQAFLNQGVGVIAVELADDQSGDFRWANRFALKIV